MYGLMMSFGRWIVDFSYMTRMGPESLDKTAILVVLKMEEMILEC